MPKNKKIGTDVLFTIEMEVFLYFKPLIVVSTVKISEKEINTDKTLTKRFNLTISFHM